MNFAAESHNSYAVLEPERVLPDERRWEPWPCSRPRARRDIGRFHHISTVRGVRRPRRSTPTRCSPRSRRTGRARRTTRRRPAADHAVRAYHETYELPVTITNCANNYGPYQFPEKVIPLFTTNALDDKPIPMYASTQNTRRVDARPRPLPRHRARDPRRTCRRDLQHRHRRRAQRSSRSRTPSSTRSASRQSLKIDRSRPSGARPAVLPRLDEDPRPSSAGSRRSTSTRACATRCSGTRTTARGGSRCASERPVVEEDGVAERRERADGPRHRGRRTARRPGRVDVRRARRRRRTRDAHARSTSPMPTRCASADRRPTPGVVVHCAAMTNVDACETDPDRAFARQRARVRQRRGRGATRWARDRRAVDRLRLRRRRRAVHRGRPDRTRSRSTDGRSSTASSASARPTPRHFIVRSAWIYGAGREELPVEAPASSPRHSESITAVVDQCGSPTYAPDLAEAIASSWRRSTYGTLPRRQRAGRCSFAEFCETARRDAQLRSRASSMSARRPRPAGAAADATRRLVPKRWRDRVRAAAAVAGRPPKRSLRLAT